MKKILLSFGILISLNYSAQTVNNCQTIFNDTVTYVKSVKTTAEDLKSVKNTNDGGSYGYAGYGQKFEAPDTISLKGFCFYGYMNDVTPDTVVASLYKIDGTGYPSVLVESVNAPIAAMQGYSGPSYDNAIKVCVDFTSMHLIEGDYMLGVQNLSPSSFFMVSNVNGNSLIDQDSLAYTYYAGVSDPTYNGWYVCSAFTVGGWDFDMIIEPVVEYTINSDLIVAMDSICPADTLMLSSNVAPFDDSIFYNRMYNPNYATYTGMNTVVSYDYGDGQSDATGNHVYGTGGDYAVSATNSFDFTGWTFSGSVTCSDTIYAGPVLNLGADTTLCNNYVLMLDAGVLDSYNWNTGQTTQTINAGPVVSAGAVTYSVEGMSNNCLVSDSITVTFQECVGVEEFITDGVKMYPNPANEIITLELSSISGGMLQIVNAQGKLVLSENITSAINKINVSSLESGIYFISILGENKIWQQKLQILR